MKRKQVSRTTLFGKEMVKEGRGWDTVEENMEKLVKNRDGELRPLLSRFGYRLIPLNDEEDFSKYLPVNLCNTWSTVLGRTRRHGGFHKLIHKDSDNFITVQIYHLFRTLEDYGRDDYPHLNVTKDVCDRMEKGGWDTDRYKKEIRSIITALGPNGGLYFLCNTRHAFQLSTFDSILEGMSPSTRNEIREDGSKRLNRLVYSPRRKKKMISSTDFISLLNSIILY